MDAVDRTAPSLFEWLGGQEVLDRLTAHFYDRVKEDAMLAPIFASMSDAHPHHVALFLAEVLGGPATYSEHFGGHPKDDCSPLATASYRAAARTMDAPSARDGRRYRRTERTGIRSAFVSYLEWGSRLAVINSADGATADANSPMPKWGWGVVKGPYIPAT